MLTIENYEQYANEALELLLQQVINLSQSADLFEGAEKKNTPSAGYSIVELSQFMSAVELGQDDDESPIEQYREVAGHAETFWRTQRSYSEQKQFHANFQKLVQQAMPSIRHESRIREIAQSMLEKHPIAEFETEDFENYMVMMTDYHFAQMCYARAVLLRRSFLITERTFHAYECGLIPFGWVSYPDSSLLCIVP